MIINLLLFRLFSTSQFYVKNVDDASNMISGNPDTWILAEEQLVCDSDDCQIGGSSGCQDEKMMLKRTECSFSWEILFTN